MSVNDDYRIRYEELKSESEREIDKYIRYLSGGALVLSLTFIGELVPSGDVKFLWVIYGGWISLVLALILNFISYFITINNTEKTIDDIDNDDKEWIKKAKKRNKPIKWFNGFSSFFSVLGIIGIGLFVTLNINNYVKKNSEPKTQGVKTRAGQESNSSDTTFTYKQTKNK